MIEQLDWERVDKVNKMFSFTKTELFTTTSWDYVPCLAASHLIVEDGFYLFCATLCCVGQMKSRLRIELQCKGLDWSRYYELPDVSVSATFKVAYPVNLSGCSHSDVLKHQDPRRIFAIDVAAKYDVAQVEFASMAMFKVIDG
jgi:hypothetical protein